MTFRVAGRWTGFGGLNRRAEDTEALMHAYGPAEHYNVKRLRDINAEMFGRLHLFKYKEEENIVDWDQYEIMKHYVPREARGEMGKRREPKVARWIREMLFDYEGSRLNWALQVYVVHGLVADMMEHTPQYVAWKGLRRLVHIRWELQGDEHGQDLGIQYE